MIVTLEDVESIGGGYWLGRPSLKDVESTNGGYWLGDLVRRMSRARVGVSG